MKKWTVVIEFTDQTETGASSDRDIIKSVIHEVFADKKWITPEIMEIIEAPYGPQHPNGVFLDERQMPKKPRWPNE